MRKPTIDENKKRPKCGRIDGQVKNGKNRSGTQPCLCEYCNKSYTLEPKQRAYNEETKALALKFIIRTTKKGGQTRSVWLFAKQYPRSLTLTSMNEKVLMCA